MLHSFILILCLLHTLFGECTFKLTTSICIYIIVDRPAHTHTESHVHTYTLYFQATTSGFASMEKASEIEQFFIANPWDAANMLVKQNCEAVRLNASWLERDSESVKIWLAQA